jgi:acetyl-CoA carboxylase biotin carboxyl carrier protein
MSDDEDIDQEALHALCQEASSLVGRLPAGLRKVSVRAGDHRVDLEWETRPAAPGAFVAAAPAAVAAGEAGADESVPDDRHAVVAVLVGTFYRSPEPGAAAFVEVGDVVEEGQDIAIIEAMKVMNRIQADRAGRVAEILVQDGEMVEFEQRLIILEPVDAEG